MDHARKVGTRDAARVADRHPILCERNRLPWLQESIRLLVPEETRLQLDVGALVIRESLSPIEPVGVHAPGPDLFCGNLTIQGEMRGAGVGMGIPDGHEIFPAPVDE